MGENHAQAWPVATYGVILFLAAVAYYILSQSLIHLHGSDSIVGNAIGPDYKGIISIALYLAAVGLAFLNPWISIGIYIFVAILWFIPDPRIEKELTE